MISTLLLSAATVLTQGDLAVRPDPCPKRPCRMHISADAKKGDAQRPLMGWSSGNGFRVNISDALIVPVAEAMATNGLKAAGYTYVNVDDGCFGGETEAELPVDSFRLGLAGKMAFFDLAERAISFRVPPHGARFFRVDAEQRC